MFMTNNFSLSRSSVFARWVILHIANACFGVVNGNALPPTWRTLLRSDPISSPRPRQGSRMASKLEHHRREDLKIERANVRRIEEGIGDVQTDFQTDAYTPTQGDGGKLAATLSGTCAEDSYTPSKLERDFSNHVEEWTKDNVTLCKHLGDRRWWIQENLRGQRKSNSKIFSVLCKRGKPPQLLEPLAGILRDPRMICDGVDLQKKFSIDFLVIGDQGNLELLRQPPAKNILFDAGGSRFMDAMHYFTSAYEQRGIIFDKIYVWEASIQGVESYWSGTPRDIRKKWQPRLTFYDGVPCTAEKSDTKNNPAARIAAECQLDDFCVLKLDIDEPEIELPIVQQLLEAPTALTTGSLLDELFFEHHVHGLMQMYGWGNIAKGSFSDSYKLFHDLRSIGIRAHSWI